MKRLNDLPEIIDGKLGEIKGYAEKLSHKQHKMHRAASEAYRNLFTAAYERWSLIKSRRNERNLKDVLSTLNQVLDVVEGRYRYIDRMYSCRGQILPFKTYEYSLHLTIKSSDVSLVEAIRKVIFLANSKSSNRPPRNYRQKSRSTGKVAELTFKEELLDDEFLRFNIYSTGTGSSAWLGFIAANAIHTCQNSRAQVKIGVLLGLDDVRRAFIGSSDGVLVVTVAHKKAAARQLHILSGQKASIIVQSGNGTDNVFEEDFFDEIRAKLKSRSPTISESFTMQSQELGGPVKTWILDDVPEQSLPKVAFVFTVIDELQTYLGYLNDAGIPKKVFGPTPADKQKWCARFIRQNDSFEVIALLNREMGNADAAALLGAVTKIDKFTSIFLIGIAATLEPEDESLGDVFIPTRVMDAQQTVIYPNGIQPRNFDRPFPNHIRELIQGFFAESIIRDRLVSTIFGEVTDRVKINTVESDNALLRDSTPSERHRAGAKSHSDKIKAYEMEAAGLAAFLENNPDAPPTFLVKGLSDKGDPGKSDDENRYKAARNAIIVALNMASYVLSIKP